MKHSESQRVKRTQWDYSFAFKVRVINEVKNGKLSYQQAQEKYAI